MDILKRARDTQSEIISVLKLSKTTFSGEMCERVYIDWCFFSSGGMVARIEAGKSNDCRDVILLSRFVASRMEKGLASRR